MHTFRACLRGFSTFSKYKFNKMEDVNTVFWKLNFWRYHKLVVLGQYFACHRRVGSSHRKWTRGHLSSIYDRSDDRISDVHIQPVAELSGRDLRPSFCFIRVGNFITSVKWRRLALSTGRDWLYKVWLYRRLAWCRYVGRLSAW